MIGKTLGHYEISAPLGRGGMGEVYQAKDQKLGRDVAIKVLPEEFAKDSDRVARFQREAKLLASLNHPNIAAIYGLEESGGTNFLVLELVEGETLADRIKAGPIPVEDSLKLALQIAEALEAAHEKGVIHRDLKPANIKVTPDGKVKVLDFGLAKAYAGEQENLNLSNSPTLSNAATQQGVILGTAAYMSPEQARGKAVDKRADIWAFGCVLYEMLTGRVAFQGDDVSEILASVIKGDVKLDLLPANLHPRVREIITRCLQKDLKKRYRDVGDVQFELEQVLADPGGVFLQPVTTVEPRTKLRTVLPWAAVTLILLIIGGLVGWNLKPTPPPEPRQVMRFDYVLPEDQQFSTLSALVVAVSPDGKQFVYCTPLGLYLRSVDQLDARLIIGTEKAISTPFFSPDGKWIGYYSRGDQKLKKIAIGGGAPVALCDVNVLAGASWCEDDTIVYGELRRGIMRVSANGGTPELLVKLTEGLYLVSPQILPDGKTILFSFVTSQRTQIVVQSLKSGEQKVLIEGGLGRYLPTGHLVYWVRNSLFAVQFDIDRLEVVGRPVPMLEGFFQIGPTTAEQGAISDSGTLIYVPRTASTAVPGRALVWVNRDGKEEPLAAPLNAYSGPRISPDGTRVALTVGTPAKTDIWIWDLVRKTLTKLTFDATLNAVPLWTPDSKWIAFMSNREGNYQVYRKASEGIGKIEPIGSVPDYALVPWSWSDNGKNLILEETSGGAIYNIGMLSMEDDRKWKPLLQEKYRELQPQISPNGRWMAYTSDESGQNEVYVRPFPKVDDGRWQVSMSGGDSPLWSPDNQELFYRSGDAVMAVSIKAEPTFRSGTPKILFRGMYFSAFSTAISSGTPWDISPDGKRFLMIKEVSPASEAAGPRKINIVLNWLDELKQRVPGK